MADIERYTPDDRRGTEQLYRRTFGIEAADRMRLRWDWERRNPANGVEPPFWVVREGPTIIAAIPLTPVRVPVKAHSHRAATHQHLSAGPVTPPNRRACARRQAR